MAPTASSNHPSRKPAFSTGGSFQALAIENLESSESDDQQNHKSPPSPKSKNQNHQLSPQAKKSKSKQRTRDRTRKALNHLPSNHSTQDEFDQRTPATIKASPSAIATTTTTMTRSTTTRTTAAAAAVSSSSSPSPSSKKLNIVPTDHPLTQPKIIVESNNQARIQHSTVRSSSSPPSEYPTVDRFIHPNSNPEHPHTSIPTTDRSSNPPQKLASKPNQPQQQSQQQPLKNLVITPPDRLQSLPVNSELSPITSPSISTTSTIPSTTDFDEEQDTGPTDHLDLTHPVPSSTIQPKHSHPSNPSSTRPAQIDPLATLPPTSQDLVPSPLTSRPSPSLTPTHHQYPSTTPRSSGSSVKHKSTSTDPHLDQKDHQISQYGADHTPGKKWQTVLTRVIWSLVMVTGFITLMALGHVYLIILVFIIQLLVFREVTNLFQVGYKASEAKDHPTSTNRKQANGLSPNPSTSNGHVGSPQPHSSLGVTSPQLSKERKPRSKGIGKNRSSKLMSWYFFCVANYFLYGEVIIYYFKDVVFIDEYLLPFARHHRFISLLFYLLGFLGFVTNLERGQLRRQFGLFSWIHMSLLLIIVFGQFMVNNILEGLIWFWVPASLVIMNDVGAYVFGMIFGKHQLIKLSPKKTVEGFVGGFFVTVIFGVLWGSLFMGWNYMVCPVKELGMTAFSEMKCERNEVFKWRTTNVREMIIEGLSFKDKNTEEEWIGNLIMIGLNEGIIKNLLVLIPNQISWAPFQLHCLVLAAFAGLVAPFGGFFASGFKRAFNIKDFGHTIPGHGGLTDRFDCQFIMGLFTYFYYSSMVKEEREGLEFLMMGKKLLLSNSKILEIILNNLNDQQLLQLFFNLQEVLKAKGLLLSST